MGNQMVTSGIREYKFKNKLFDLNKTRVKLLTSFTSVPFD